MDDDEGYPPEGGCIGFGSVSTISERRVRKPVKHPIGFIHFPEKIEKKTRAVKAKPKKRKR